MAEKDGLLKFDHPREQSSIIKVLGVGGGGSNAVNHMFRQGIHGVDFVICNTDAQAIQTSPVPIKIQLGNSLTGGNGAGSRPEVGMNAAIEDLEQIREVLERDTRMVFITAGMGGGTGTGGAPVIAKLAKEMGILTIGIVTIPFSFEGRKRRQVAENGIQELRQHVDTLLIINNDKLRELHGNLELWEAFARADNILTEAAKGIAEIITHIGYINVDFEDVKTVMKDSGVAIMGTGIASGENRASLAVEEALSSPLLNDNQIRGASNVLLYISSGTKGIRLDEVTEITDYIQEEAGSNAEIIWGNGSDENLGENIAVTIIATGFSTKSDLHADLMSQRKQVVVKPLQPNLDHQTHLETRTAPITEMTVITRNEPSTAQPQDPIIREDEEPPFEITNQNMDIGDPTSAEPKETGNYREPVTMTRGTGEPDNSSSVKEPDRISTIDYDQKQQDRVTRLRELTMKIKTPEGLKEIESLPAFKRRQIDLAPDHQSAKSEVSRFTLNDGEEPSLGQNTFLHSKPD
jgi:cell division protein FtsZ